MLNLYKAIVAKLAAEATLISLTGHTSTDRRIAREMPPIKAKIPYLGVSVAESIPLVADVPHIEQAQVEFYCCGRSDYDAIALANALVTLLKGAEDTETPTNVVFYNFSNADICNRMTRYRRTRQRRFDDETDAWWIVVDVFVIWVNAPCAPA